MRALGNGSEIVVCEEVGEYRDAAKAMLKREDYVLDVGCHVGGTTKVIAPLVTKVIGLDQKALHINEARGTMPHIQWEIGDAFDATFCLSLAKSIQPNRFRVIFVDISGSRDLATVVKLLDMYESTLKPEIIIVKSQPMKRLLLRGHLWVEHPMNPQLNTQ